MSIDYQRIADDHREDYGRKVGKLGKQLLSNLYDDRTHFVYELLQNAEDALGQIPYPQSRRVTFELHSDGLAFSHFGKPFDEADIRSVCAIVESTKPESAGSIGRFGIGFKSVYAYTDAPEIHSGQESFVIRDYVFPAATCKRSTEPGQTRIWLPFGDNRPNAFEEIQKALERLTTRTLLFLRHIEELAWRVEGADKVVLARSPRVNESSLLEHITLTRSIETQTSSQWLMATRSVQDAEGILGSVQIAFYVNSKGVIEVLKGTNLCVYFETAVKTGLGFCIQGPFQTTPSRDNVLRDDPWNRQLVTEIGDLLVEAIRAFRDTGRLDPRLFEGLPVVPEALGEEALLAPLTQRLKQALANEPLLPDSQSGFVKACDARLAGSEELRQLLSPNQMQSLFGGGDQQAWLHSDIGSNQTPKLNAFLRRHLSVQEIDAEKFVRAANAEFLAAQSDEWMIRFYRFLSNQSALVQRLKHTLPWIRLEDGRHVTRGSDSQPNAFLPINEEGTVFPTVRKSLCQDPEALDFLKRHLGLRQPDPVDVVVKSVLPQYTPKHRPTMSVYGQHMANIEATYSAAGDAEKQRLVEALKTTPFILAVDGQGARAWLRPDDVYEPVQPLTTLFEGISDIRFPSTNVGLRGNDVRRKLLVQAGMRTHLAVHQMGVDPAKADHMLRGQKYSTRAAGEDYGIAGLTAILKSVKADDGGTAGANRAASLWKALAQVSRQAILNSAAEVRYQHYGWHTIRGAAQWVELLQETAWVPSPEGAFVKPSEIAIPRVPGEWQRHEALENLLGFQPPLLEELAERCGISLSVIDKFKANGLTESDLDALIAQKRSSTQSRGAWPIDYDPDTSEKTEPQGNEAGDRAEVPTSRNAPRAGTRTFESYIKVAPTDEEEEEEVQRDAEVQEAKLSLERRAIDLILRIEPSLKQAPQTHRGFDLFEENEAGEPVRWVEVKSMTTTMDFRPATISRSQFQAATEQGHRYWLYVVENADSDRPRIVRIQDPAGNAKNFTFDRGWRGIAKMTTIDTTTGEIVEEDL